MIVYSEKYLEHSLELHPENSMRLKAVVELLTRKSVFEKIPLVKPARAEREDILRVHIEEHYDLIKRISEKGGGSIDADTYVTEKSFETAMLAAGGVMSCIDGCMEGYEHSFALVRPPGHHAESNRAMGFCLFNNAAVGAKYAMDEYGMKKIFILDWDVHHGNGTQEIFYSSPEVLYVSLHQHPLYPGTGHVDEVGSGNGAGYNINIPLPPGTCDSSYLEAFDGIVMPVLRQFDPELVIVSAGYDAHHDDPLGGMNLSSSCYYEMTKRLAGASKKIVLALEGGYDLTALAKSVFATLAALFDLEKGELERFSPENEKVTKYAESKIRAVKNNISRYWKVT